ncbi:uncharacterized protein VTP21DRAFT_5841 [Calcarisporiella thermophila]|uniref:uncharacterized protein n=1 Tax=Calcarisporiella thermophila TaxID=911321 RepID=UPI003744A37B
MEEAVPYTSLGQSNLAIFVAGSTAGPSLCFCAGSRGLCRGRVRVGNPSPPLAPIAQITVGNWIYPSQFRQSWPQLFASSLCIPTGEIAAYGVTPAFSSLTLRAHVAKIRELER